MKPYTDAELEAMMSDLELDRVERKETMGEDFFKLCVQITQRVGV